MDKDTLLSSFDKLVAPKQMPLNRGYLDYRKYDNYCDCGIHFVSRLKDNAVIEEVCKPPTKILLWLYKTPLLTAADYRLENSRKRAR